jgi:hypothetical protein
MGSGYSAIDSVPLYIPATYQELRNQYNNYKKEDCQKHATKNKSYLVIYAHIKQCNFDESRYVCREHLHKYIQSGNPNDLHKEFIDLKSDPKTYLHKHYVFNDSTSIMGLWKAKYYGADNTERI